ncbi:MAG: beta-ketoacyl synthase [Gammaproteobacteria bacterium]|nr:beta-ketoacyl synthase [Gammaproteobacteria bacterium]
MRLPVLIAAGGVNPAGRISGHHAYRRTQEKAKQTWKALATLMGEPATPERQAYLRDHTLVRRIETQHMDVDAIPQHRAVNLAGAGDAPLTFRLRKRQLPETLPAGWTVSAVDDDTVEVQCSGGLAAFIPETRQSRVQVAGQLPTGFDPEKLYASRSHPRGLAMTIFAASDALGSAGLSWETLRQAVAPDEIAVYASSGMSQLDQNGNGGMMQAALLGKRVSSKQLPLGLPQMPADFVNAYVLGSAGSTGANIGACATYLYNLRQGVDDIRSGRRRVVLIGCAEAPILPEIIEGYRTMGALAEDEALMRLDGASTPDYRRACRPFAENCGFTLSESAVFSVLVDDALAVELGANVLGAVPEVFIYADGYKKSMVGRALGLLRSMLGQQGLDRSYIHAHGTGTPQNRVTESHIMSELAKTFGIARWPVAAIKAYLGHSLSPAAGDQLASALGTFADHIIPGITTIDRVAEDVHTDRLHFPLAHEAVEPGALDAVLLNSKGFGGNNATGLVLSPEQTRRMLEARHGAEAMTRWQRKNESVSAASQQYDTAMGEALQAPIYRFGEGVVDGLDLTLSDDAITIPGFANPVSLAMANPFEDMT